jgi:hypothetical protein
MRRISTRTQGIFGVSITGDIIGEYLVLLIFRFVSHKYCVDNTTERDGMG